MNKIQPEELRVGNILYDEFGTVLLVREIREFNIRASYFRSDTGNEHVSLMSYNLLYPIPLETTKLVDIFGTLPEWIKSVHELQNFCYYSNNKQEVKMVINNMLNGIK